MRHDVSEVARTGKENLRDFLAHMARRCDGTLTDMVVMVDAAGARRRRVRRQPHLSRDRRQPAADARTKMQAVRRRLFDLRDGRIASVAISYDLQDRPRQVA